MSSKRAGLYGFRTNDIKLADPPGHDGREKQKMPTIDLEQQLREYQATFATSAPAGRAALYQAKIDELQANFVFREALDVGDRAPEFHLPGGQGIDVSLASVLRRGPAIITFYRGAWCPYCNLQLRAYQAFLPQFQAFKAGLLAISPQVPDGSLSTAEKNALAFEVLSDVGNKVARQFGLVYTLPVELQDTMVSNGKALPPINGDESWELPITATYVVSREGRITLAFIDTDYRRRLAPEKIVQALRELPAAG
jgi:peroxiredoxin